MGYGKHVYKETVTHGKVCAKRDMTVSKNASLEEIREFFAHDRFATVACGAVIVCAEEGHAICEMDISDIHLNAMGNVMGGAIFSLADFALAIASNLGESPSVSVSNTIDFMNRAKGKKLIAECSAEKDGRSLGFYHTIVTDDLGTSVARMTAVCVRV